MGRRRQFGPMEMLERRKAQKVSYMQRKRKKLEVPPDPPDSQPGEIQHLAPVVNPPFRHERNRLLENESPTATRNSTQHSHDAFPAADVDLDVSMGSAPESECKWTNVCNFFRAKKVNEK